MMDRPADEFEDALPPGLVEGLGQAYGRSVEVPRAIDQAVLGAMREKFARRRRMRLIVRWGAVASGAVAACVVLAIWLGSGDGRATQMASTPATVAIKGDIDASGRVDMVDALLLARRVKRGEKLDAAWDINGDGKVDQADVEAIAHGAVTLRQGGLAGAEKRGEEVARSLPAFEELGVGRAVASAPAQSSTPMAIDHAQMHLLREDRP